MSKLSEVFFLLVEDEDLPNRYKDHLLSGNWKGHVIFILSRTGC
jgi:mRNA-degrading endonuclease YafQ of YafQ-DinJ toxin-antitoxin module